MLYPDSLFTPNFLLCRYTEYGAAVPRRPAEDLAFSVARFIQNGGAFVNYYMVAFWSFLWYPLWIFISPFMYHNNSWFRNFDLNLMYLIFWVQYHGGTNFGHTSGGPFIATSYDYDAPIDEFGMHIKLNLSTFWMIIVHILKPFTSCLFWH